MAFGLTADGFKVKRLDDIKGEIEQRFKDEFGDEIDLDPATPEGQMIGIMAEREAAIWELAQAEYDSKNPNTSEGKPLDDLVAITGTTRTPAKKSSVDDGIARGTDATNVPAGTIISVTGNPESRFVTQIDALINIVDGPTFKSGPIELIAEDVGAIQANAGTLTVIETAVPGMDSFTNESDADLGAKTQSDADLKLKRNTELQLAGSATIDAIISEMNAREDVDAVIVFQNKESVVIDGLPPHSLDIVIEGGDEQDIADAIFKVVGGGIQTVGDIAKTTFDSEGFSHITKFSRPTDVPIWIEMDLTVNGDFYPIDGDAQVEQALLDYGERKQSIGVDVVVFGSDSLICAINDIPGITDVEIRVGKTVNPALNNNIVIESRERAKFDSARITIIS